MEREREDRTKVKNLYEWTRNENISYTHVSFDSSIVWYLLKQISGRHKNVAKRKAIAAVERLRGKEGEMNGLHRKDLFFLHPNMKCHLFRCGWLFYFAPNFFLSLHISLWHASLMVCRIGVTAEREKKIERVIFFNMRLWTQLWQNGKRFHSL